METIAKHRHARSSAKKVRLVADLIRGKKVSQALDILTYTNKKAAVLVRLVSWLLQAKCLGQQDTPWL